MRGLDRIKCKSTASASPSHPRSVFALVERIYLLIEAQAGDRRKTEAAINEPVAPSVENKQLPAAASGWKAMMQGVWVSP